MRALTLVGAAFVATSFATNSAAELINIEWDASGEFSRSVTVPARKFVEVCGKLKRGAEIEWQFRAQQPLDFNIHYHVGEKVEFPEKRTAVTTFGSRLVVQSEQDYCWMWKSAVEVPIPLEIRLLAR